MYINKDGCLVIIVVFIVLAFCMCWWANVEESIPEADGIYYKSVGMGITKEFTVKTVLKDKVAK